MVSLLFGLGPLFGGFILVTFALAFSSQHALLSGVSSGIALLLASWRPLQLLATGKMWPPTVLLLLASGAAASHAASSALLKLSRHKKSSLNELSSPSFSGGLSLSVVTLQSLLACGAVFSHALAEGLALGVAAPRAYGLGRHMVLPVSLHGLPRGAAVASCVLGVTGSWRAALGAAAATGLAGPVAAIGAIVAGIDYRGLDYLMVFSCGLLVPSFASVFRRATRLEAAGSFYGLLIGLGFACACLTSTKVVCLHTSYCNSAPEAVR